MITTVFTNPMSRNSICCRVIIQLQRTAQTVYNTYIIYVWMAADRLALVLDDGLEVRKAVPDFQDLLELVVIFDNDDVTLSAIGDRVTCIRRVCGIDAGR